MTCSEGALLESQDLLDCSPSRVYQRKYFSGQPRASRGSVRNNLVNRHTGKFPNFVRELILCLERIIITKEHVTISVTAFRFTTEINKFPEWGVLRKSK